MLTEDVCYSRRTHGGVVTASSALIESGRSLSKLIAVIERVFVIEFRNVGEQRTEVLMVYKLRAG